MTSYAPVARRSPQPTVRRTAEHHVANILSKLGLRSRAEAAAYAVRELPEGSVAE